MKKKAIILSLAFLLASCGSAQGPTEVPTEKPSEPTIIEPSETPTETPTEVPTQKPTEVPTEKPTDKPTDKPTEKPTDKPTEPGETHELVDLGGGKIKDSLPEGFTFVQDSNHGVVNDPYYGSGALKCQYINDYILSNKFESKNHVEVEMNLTAFYKKGWANGVGEGDWSFKVYGLNEHGDKVAADGILKNIVTPGVQKLILEGPGIVQVKILYSASATDIENYYNIALGGVTLKGHNFGSDEIKNTEPENDSGNKPVEPEIPADKILATPTELTIKDYVLTWKSVENATSYRVFVNGENIIAQEAKQDIFYLLKDGIRNTIKVQALDDNHKFNPSEFAVITLDVGGPFEGISIETNETLNDTLTIQTTAEGQKYIEISYSDILMDDTHEFADVVLKFDYDINNYKFYSETNDATLFVDKQSNTPGAVRVAFKSIGEIKLSVVENGTTDKDFVYDSIIVKCVESTIEGFDRFEIGMYSFEADADGNYQISPVETVTIKNDPESYIYLTAIVEPYDSQNPIDGAVTWEIISGEALELSFTYDLDAYYVPVKDVYGDVTIRAVSKFGQTDTVTVHVI